MTKKGSTKIVNFLKPRAEILVLGRGNMSYSKKNHYLFKKKTSSLIPGIDETI